MRKFRPFDALAMQGKVNLPTDALWLQLHSPTMAPNLDTWAHASDLTNELPTGGGYTAGGIQLSGVTTSYVTAASWGFPWTASAAHLVEDVVRPSTANGFLYRCSMAGTSSATQPTWPTTLGQTVTDGSVTWVCSGNGVTQLAASNATWASPFTAGPFRWGVLIDKTPATAATQPLIGLSDYGAGGISGQGGSFLDSFNAEGIFLIFEV